MHIKTARSHSAGSPAEVNWFSVTIPPLQGVFFCLYYESKSNRVSMKTMIRDYSYDQKETIKGFFSDDEWNAIDSAMQDFQDYGDKETDLANSIGSKLYHLFKNDKDLPKITDL